MIDFIKKFLNSIETDPDIEFKENLDYEAAYKQTFWELDIKFKDQEDTVHFQYNKRYYIGNGKIEELPEYKREAFLFNFCRDMYIAILEHFFDIVAKRVGEGDSKAYTPSHVVSIVNKLKSDVLDFLKELFE